MKKLLAFVLAALCFNALAVDAMSLITPSPLGVVLAFNTYFKDKKKVYYIRVEAQAQDFEKAKKQAFRLASEQVAGTVVLSESELRNSNLTRNEIITYSSGLIDEYKILDRIDGPGYVKLTMDVWITESVMAQRLLAKSATEKGIDGVDLSVRNESILDEARRGDAIFQAIMRDFPKRAFRVKMSQPNISMDGYRDTRVAVDFEISWDEKFANAFDAAAKETGQAPCRALFGCPPAAQFYIQNWGFNDAQKLVMIDNYIKSTAPAISIEIQDIYGNVAKRECFQMNIQDFYFFGSDGRVTGLSLNTRNAYRARASLNIGQNTKAMARLENVHVEVVTKSQCRAL